jgi:hypothetical protein
MAARKRPHFAPHREYVSADPRKSEEVFYARLRMGQVIKLRCPTLLEDLARDVFPFVSRIPEGDSTKTGIADDCLDAIAVWANKFNIDSKNAWFLGDVLRTLEYWRRHRGAREALMWAPVLRPVRISHAGLFEFRHKPWTTDLTWADYKNALQKEFKVALSEYEKRVRELAESQGLVRVQRTHSPRNFDWFVLYQFAGKSSKEIVDACKDNVPVDESTVLKGIHRAAKLVGWDRLRKPSRD